MNASTSAAKSDGPKPCRIALLGCGAVSELFHAPALQHLETVGEVVVVAVYDPDAGRVATLCEKFPNAAAQSDDSFLQKMPIDLAIVAAPVKFHETLAIRAFEAGIAVLCEKPLAADTASGERMIAAARKHQRPLAVGLLRRFYTNVQFTRKFIQNQTLGALKSFSIQEGGYFDWPARSDSFFRKATAGGGTLLDAGVHVLDLVVHWFGEPEQLSYADDAMGGLESNCKLDLTYPGGVKGTIQLSRDWDTTNLYIINFERGTLKIPAGYAEPLQLEIEGSPLFLDTTVKRREGVTLISAGFFHQGFLSQLQDLIQAVRTNTEPSVPGEEAIRSLRLIEYCYKNRKLLDMPWLTPEENKAAHLLSFGGSR